ncbi:unnamed protein product [Brugia timori]|uniref:GLOBIN domain-containing protein n=1 Tax=Brugia timori TaxID=42155 RepID=A0A0R3QNY8_9BILA|nr:unnamed protein product [Brugia timori]
MSFGIAEKVSASIDKNDVRQTWDFYLNFNEYINSEQQYSIDRCLITVMHTFSCHPRLTRAIAIESESNAVRLENFIARELTVTFLYYSMCLPGQGNFFVGLPVPYLRQVTISTPSLFSGTSCSACDSSIE